MRGPVPWIVGIVVGVLVVIGVTALIGNRDKSGDTVPAGEWAQTTCGVVATWRGEMKSIVEDIRTPTAVGSPTEEPQSETPQGRTGLIRSGLERAVRATDTMVTGIDNAGVPDTENGEESARAVSAWADTTHNDLQDALDSLDTEADTLADSIRQLTDAVRAIGTAITSGVKTVADLARTDPQLADALRESSTCQQLREEK